MVFTIFGLIKKQRFHNSFLSAPTKPLNQNLEAWYPAPPENNDFPATLHIKINCVFSETNGNNCFTKSIYVFRSKKPYFEAIFEEKQIQVSESEKITVYFVRALKNPKNTLQDYVDIRDGKWIDKNPFLEEDLNDFLVCLQTNLDILE